MSPNRPFRTGPGHEKPPATCRSMTGGLGAGKNYFFTCGISVRERLTSKK